MGGGGEGGRGWRENERENDRKKEKKQTDKQIDRAGERDHTERERESARKCVYQYVSPFLMGFTSLHIRTHTAPPLGTPGKLGTLRLCGILEHVGAPEAQCAWPSGMWNMPWYLPIQQPAALQVGPI